MAPSALKKLVKEQSIRAGSIKRLIQKAKNSPPERRTFNRLLITVEKLRSYWSDYQRAHVTIASMDDATTDEYITNDVFEQLEAEVD